MAENNTTDNKDPNDPKNQPPKPPVLTNVQKRLQETAGGAGKIEDEDEELPRPSEPQAFDLTKLSGEQLQLLKSMLNATPDRVTRKNKNPIVALKELNGKLIVDFGTAFNSLVKDPVANMTVEMVQIPVKYLGSEKMVNVPWKDFIIGKKVNCEVIHTENIPGSIIEGEVVSKETGALVEMEIKTLQTFFTVKLPEGYGQETLKIEARIANA